MQTYLVSRKADGQEIYRYSSEAPIEWSGMEFSLCNHTAETPAEPVQIISTNRRRTKLGFIGLIGEKFADILSAAKVNVEVEMFVRMLDWATPDPDGTSVDLDDPRVISALNRLEAVGILNVGQAQEILNG